MIVFGFVLIMLGAQANECHKDGLDDKACASKVWAERVAPKSSDFNQ